MNQPNEPKVCCICQCKFDGYGNNAEPVAVGQCCDECNMSVVVPARLEGIYRENQHFGCQNF